MSAAPLPAPDPEAAKLARMSELWRWLVSLGVCDGCASGWAIAQVEREAGEKWAPWPRKCERRNRQGHTCREAAMAAWPKMPKRVGT